MTPDASEAVCLQLHLNRQAVGFGLRGMLLLLADLRLNAQQFLYVMTHFMSNDVPRAKSPSAPSLFSSHRRMTGRYRPYCRQDNRRAHYRLTGAAAGTGRAAIEHQLWLRVLAAHLFKDRPQYLRW